MGQPLRNAVPAIHGDIVHPGLWIARLARFAGLSSLAVLLALPLSVRADPAWPSHPFRLVVPFAAGGTADTLGRLVAQKLSDTLGQPFIVENRGGAGGIVGSEIVAKAAPDGYTLLVSGVASHVLAPAVSKVPFDPIKDFTHIALFGGPPIALCVNLDLPAKNLKELVALARTRPLSYGSPGPGTQGQLIAELFRKSAGIDLTHIPYKGASLAITDLIGGQIPASSTTLTTASGQIHAGRIRALAISTRKRLADYPDVPTFYESGYPNLVAYVWFSLSGPAGIPKEIVNRLNLEVRKALGTEALRERLKLEGIEGNDFDADQFKQFVKSELARWTPIVKGSAVAND
jgi:tripartite-type tricarboxylate transporter receptor subunit TctC